MQREVVLADAFPLTGVKDEVGATFIAVRLQQGLSVGDACQPRLALSAARNLLQEALKRGHAYDAHMLPSVQERL